MYNKYAKRGCPAAFPVHTKCVGLFQSLGGIDVLLFAMYMYEYNDKCPAPNRRRVYISYLDSVKYFEPSRYRTYAYQSMIIEYLRYAKMRGFHSAHLWSCPPAPGDEYVFHCHPPQQKVPQEEMLRKWYYGVLDISKEEGIVVETTDFHEEYFKDGGKNAPLGDAPTPASLPYFEGDYIPGEIETIVADLNKEERMAGKKGSDDDHAVPAQKKAASGRRSGTRSNPGQLLNEYQDKVMNRLGSATYNMRENLIIARLRNRHFVAAIERGDDVSNWPDDDTYLGEQISSDRCDSYDDRTEIGYDNSKQHEINGKETTTAITTTSIGSTVEEDPQFESDMFENRLLFLNYCQSNNCQFDELRRAKHSTMMILYQLHNPSEPKFVQRCAGCACDIVTGNRFHCNICPNYDLCQSCHGAILLPQSKRKGSTLSHDRTHTFVRMGVGASVTAAKSRDDGSIGSREDKAKALNAYLEVLSHAAHCSGPPSCRLHNCAKMKQLFGHVKTCEVTHSNGCKICARLLSLIVVHARSCTVRVEGCPLPYCDKIRERNERVRRQQLFMDDRRRQAQNAFYHSGES